MVEMNEERVRGIGERLGNSRKEWRKRERHSGEA